MAINYNKIQKPSTPNYNGSSKIGWNLLINAIDFLLINPIDKLVTTYNVDDIWTYIEERLGITTEDEYVILTENGIPLSATGMDNVNWHLITKPE